MSDLLETAELEAFVQIVDAGSLSKAAELLGVPRATLTRRLARLEARLDTRLLHRTTRQLVLTDAGAGFHRHAMAILAAVEAAQTSVRQVTGRVAGDLRVSLPPGDQTLLYPLLAQFASNYPDVRLQATFSTAHVDLLRDGFDVALRAGQTTGDGLVMRTIAHAHRVGVASVGYIERHGMPTSVEALANHRLLGGFDRGAVPSRQWSIEGGSVRVDPYISANDVQFLAHAVTQGLGIGVMPREFLTKEFEAGEVVEVLPEVLRADARVAVVYPDREYLAPQVRAFVDHVVDWAHDRGFLGTNSR